MTKLSWWKRSIVALGAIAAGLGVLALGPRPGAGAGPPAQDPPADKNLYRGAVSCQACHSNADNPAFVQAKGFVKLDEYKTWKTVDKHSVAFANLLSPRGKQMASLLKVADLTDRKVGCVGCHEAGDAEVNNRTKEGISGDVFDPNEGVSCENCHGPSSRWWPPHIDASFRKKTGEEREKLGLVNLRSPIRQADQCLSCHIGNAAEGKVVTHEMYAAGHPPLPSIEVATFSDLIPRHWWLVAEKPSEAVRQAAGFKPGEKERTRLSLVGAAVALQTTMNLLAGEAKAQGDTPVPGLDWPDYARFDCWSCHHDLKRESWRQERGFSGSPGRPPISEWPLAIVELGIDRLELDDPAARALRTELATHREAVLKEANAKPYGRKAPMGEAAASLAKWSDVLIRRLATATYDEDVALKLLRRIVARSQEYVADYDAARHIAWTIKILVEDAGSKIPNRPAIDAVLKKFDDGLKLQIPAGRDYQIEDQLGPALRIIGDYEPSQFDQHLRELAGLLPPG